MNRVIKKTARTIAYLAILPSYGIYLLLRLGGDDRRIFRTFSQCYALIPGLLGEYLRLQFYRLALRSCSESCCISFGTIFSTADVELHDNVYIGAYCIIGRARIGRDTLVASRVSIVSGIHQHGIERTDVPIREQEGVFEEIHIGEDCWIGEAAIVGAHIGAHAVIGAGCVALHEVEPYAVMSGNPATLIKSRQPTQ